jgi:hypothetical protein
VCAVLKAWHWTRADRKLRYGDSRTVEPGQLLTVDCNPVLCKSGLHASTNILDALASAPGPYIWRVELGGTIVRGTDKAAATERRALWGIDATGVLWRFARRCAADVLPLWDAPDVVVRFLRTGDEQTRAAAWDASWGAVFAAEVAPWVSAETSSIASWSAGMASSWDAPWSAAWAAAWAAARAAASADSRAAADGALRGRQARRLAAMVSRARKAS